MSTPAMPWTKYAAQPASSAPWEKYAQSPGAAAVPPDTRNAVQRGFDDLTTVTPQQDASTPEFLKPVAHFGAGVIEGVGMPFIHPIQSLEGIGNLLQNPVGTVGEMIHSAVSDPSKTLGATLGGAELGDVASDVPTLLGEGGSAIRKAAIGDPDVAAVRAAGVPKKSALGFKSDVQAARPYLTGSQSVEDVQKAAGLGGTARDEIYKPISDFLSEHGARVVQGPDGPTTLNALEGERAQISGQLRQLKSGGPEGIALATQKGLNQADLLARQHAIEGAMDPHIMGAGIDSPLIRQTYGQVARVGDQFAGRWTPAEKPQPYGFGRLTNVDVLKPRTWLGQPAQGVRDLIAGRPLWSGNAGDVGVREAFREGGPKPDLRAPASAMPPWENSPRLLEANVPGNAPYGEEPYPGSMNGMPEPNPIRVTSPPPGQPLLPAAASGPNYMRRYVEPPEPSTIRPMPPEQHPLLPANASPGEAQPMLQPLVNRPVPYAEPYDPHLVPFSPPEYLAPPRPYTPPLITKPLLPTQGAQ